MSSCAAFNKIIDHFKRTQHSVSNLSREKSAFTFVGHFTGDSLRVMPIVCNVFVVLQEVSEKGSKISQLENEKSALIRDLFNSKTTGKNGFSAKKANNIF